VQLKKTFYLVWMGLFLAVSPVKAALTYGNGYYTNLCDSGTAATYYNCDSGCDPKTGSCRSETMGVVKWVCSGKWNQCLESESQWSNLEQVDNIGCGYTVQISKFSEKCRMENGSWNSNCRLLGYMVWYSGDCWQEGTPRVPTGRPSSTPKPIVSLTVTPSQVPNAQSKLASVLTITPTQKPSPSPTGGVGERICGLKCKGATDCQAGFACVSGACRNPACETDKTCFCLGGKEATSSAITKKSPDTGPEVWLGMAGMVFLGWLGLRMRRAAKKLWI